MTILWRWVNTHKLWISAIIVFVWAMALDNGSAVLSAPYVLLVVVIKAIQEIRGNAIKRWRNRQEAILKSYENKGGR